MTDTMIKDVIHFYRVESLDKVKKFYQNIIGLTLYKDQGKCLIYDVFGHGKIGFCTHFPKDQITQSCITLVYNTQSDIDEMYQKLVTHGHQVNAPEINSYFNIYHFFLIDDNQLTLEFQVFL